VFAAAQEFRRSESFSAIGLLNEDCVIGRYPSFVLEGENVTLCVYVYNHMNEPEAFRVVYRLGNQSSLPTNQTPSPAPELRSIAVVLDHGQEALLREAFPVPKGLAAPGGNATMIFELWAYDPRSGEWVYTGRWVHLHVRVEEAPLP